MADSFKLPNFLILGAQKAGTTTLHHTLEKHPEVFTTKPKEISFFNIDANFEQGVKWYSSFFKRWDKQKTAGESTPSYLWDEKVPPRIKRILPDAKFIILLRNPVDRAYSAFWYAFIGGNETLPFKQALEAEPNRAKQGPAIRGYSSYVERGLYAQQIKRYYEYFHPSQFLILIAEEYKQNPENTLRQVTRFLNISCDNEFIENTKKVNRNVSRIPRSKKIHRIVPFLLAHFPIAARVIRRINLKNGKYPLMPPEIRRKLLDRFIASNVKLEEILGRKLDSWNE